MVCSPIYSETISTNLSKNRSKLERNAQEIVASCSLEVASLSQVKAKCAAFETELR